MTLAVQGVELFRLVKREKELHRQILTFSISHDNRSVRIYGHYPVIEGKKTMFYSHPIHTFDFIALDGEEKWPAYRFMRNVYEAWMAAHFKKLCLTIDTIPYHPIYSSNPRENPICTSPHHLGFLKALKVNTSRSQEPQMKTN
ncbi:uncharacterized protein Z519_09298 [Cladophialophora bantiana CBS 173.52]|uniref:DUF7924 domain-containing protein n=1 Tax=Cladophialophora bantiana (strain ATCC 10958 / CBS 173.52 / CDC B-1940 / NIH 8579) TaxID=1442370 RepID=A0A0D2HZ44_CLAB1|nr:uncharacterized protein Z519_09298 [Cladophialophora bantiana CBS 173.52]KIW89869.1 hypothetical protein Z519_09298 [Cladophialophora bantiana CBS 173.52]